MSKLNFSYRQDSNDYLDGTRSRDRATPPSSVSAFTKGSIGIGEILSDAWQFAAANMSPTMPIGRRPTLTPMSYDLSKPNTYDWQILEGSLTYVTSPYHGFKEFQVIWGNNLQHLSYQVRGRSVDYIPGQEGDTESFTVNSIEYEFSSWNHKPYSSTIGADFGITSPMGEGHMGPYGQYNTQEAYICHAPRWEPYFVWYAYTRRLVGGVASPMGYMASWDTLTPSLVVRNGNAGTRRSHILSAFNSRSEISRNNTGSAVYGFTTLKPSNTYGAYVYDVRF